MQPILVNFQSATSTLTGIIYSGTREYIVPSKYVVLASNQQQVRASQKDDVWSLGVILYVMIYKRFPIVYNNQNQYSKNFQIEAGTWVIFVKLLTRCLVINEIDRASIPELLNIIHSKSSEYFLYTVQHKLLIDVFIRIEEHEFRKIAVQMNQGIRLQNNA